MVSLATEVSAARDPGVALYEKPWNQTLRDSVFCSPI
jgi:hypothetical protein